MGLYNLVARTYHCLPLRAKVWLRSSPLLRRWFGKLAAGTRSVPFPDSPYTLYLDGFRNAGFVSNELSSYERAARNVARDLLQTIAPQCVWDIGANIGTWSLFLSSLRPAVPTLVCFEPDPVNLQYLRMNRERNHLSWDIRELALSDHEGEAEFYADEITGSTGSLEGGEGFIGAHFNARPRKTTVKVSTVDRQIALGAPLPQFIKIDVEGHELALLRGARELLSRHHPALMLECTKNAAEVGEFLRSLGYTLVDVETNLPVQDPVFETLAIWRDGRPAAG